LSKAGTSPASSGGLYPAPAVHRRDLTAQASGSHCRAASLHGRPDYRPDCQLETPNHDLSGPNSSKLGPGCTTRGVIAFACEFPPGPRKYIAGERGGAMRLSAAGRGSRRVVGRQGGDISRIRTVARQDRRYRARAFTPDKFLKVPSPMSYRSICSSSSSRRSTSRPRRRSVSKSRRCYLPAPTR
jgi:hypothetical protein